ncbi:MAG TPA: tetratricopeptide repeat protein [Patescibacteria group bacterium]|nr:tetratricopeptide repeat protein [Patescibacteria group bacterium]
MQKHHNRTISLSAKIAAYVFALFSVIAPARAQWSIMKADADSLIKAGSDHIYNMQFERASADFGKVSQMYPEHPASYFLDAMVEWWRIKTVDNPKDEALEQAFMTKIDKAINVSQKLLDQSEYDITGLFFKAGALGYRGRFYAERERWVKAAADGKDALEMLQKAQRIAPGNHDILLGTGLYNYLAQALPEQYPALKSVMFFLPAGNKQVGLSQLVAASNKARYAATESKVVLLQVYSMFEKNPDELLKLSTELHAKYPNNPYFHWYLGRAYTQLGYTDKMEETWREIVKAAIDKKPGYNRSYAREALYYIGQALMARGEYEDALKYFYKADEAGRSLTRDDDGWILHTNMNIGKIYDMQGKRDLAVKQYSKIMSWREKFSSKYDQQFQMAQELIQKPYGQ